MQALSVVSVLWVVSVVAFIALMVYRAHLTNHETDELFLGSENGDSTRKIEHDEIVTKVHRIKPWCQGAGGMAAIMTFAIVGIEAARVVSMIQ